jgi:hypothetical protein
MQAAPSIIVAVATICRLGRHVVAADGLRQASGQGTAV